MEISIALSWLERRLRASWVQFEGLPLDRLLLATILVFKGVDIGLHALLEEGIIHCSFQTLLVRLVMCHHADLFLHDEDAFGADRHTFPLLCRLAPNRHQRLLQGRILFFLLMDVMLQLLVVLVDLRLTIILHTLNFLAQLLHEHIDFAS